MTLLQLKWCFYHNYYCNWTLNDFYRYLYYKKLVRPTYHEPISCNLCANPNNQWFHQRYRCWDSPNYAYEKYMTWTHLGFCDDPIYEQIEAINNLVTIIIAL